MKIALFSPYFPGHFGGGEKHFLQIASILSENHECYICIPSLGYFKKIDSNKEREIKKNYSAFFNLNLKKIKFINSPIGTNSNWLKKFIWTKQFDYFYSFTDGSLFLSGAKQNNLHFQVPFSFPKNGVLNRIKLMNWGVKNANSEFTKRIIEKSWKTKIDYVHYPLVDSSNYQPSKDRKRIILGVGRFFKQLHSKRQDILIKAFIEFVKKMGEKSKEWKLVLVGTAEDKDYLNELMKMSENYSVEFVTSATHQELNKLYQTAEFFWHATGFGIDEEKNPEQVEHFGIATVEAMAGGSIPLVVPKGGQNEIMTSKLAQLTWNTIDECVEKTVMLINDNSLRSKLRTLAINRAKDFGLDRYRKTLNKMINNHED